MEEIANRIIRYQVADIQQVMRTTVIDCIFISQQQRKKGSSSESIDNFNDAAMVEMDIEQLYKLITPDVSVNCVIRCCEVLTEIVHTHYMISQWHRSPFDPRNMDSNHNHLHRCKAILREEEALLDSFSDDEEGDEESLYRGRSSSVDATPRDRFGSIELEPSSDIEGAAAAANVEGELASSGEVRDLHDDGTTSKENTDETSSTITPVAADRGSEDATAVESVSSQPSSPPTSSSRPRSYSNHANHRRNSSSSKTKESPLGKEFKIGLDYLSEDILGDIYQPIAMQVC
jgi:hypothetical protein